MTKVLCMIVAYLVQMAFLSCLFSERRPSLQVNQDETIARVKHLDVSKLDAHLKKQEFATWLADILGSGSILSWEINDCGEQTGGRQDVDRDIPTCVQAEATVAGEWNVVIMIQIGTIKTGPLTKAVLKDAFIQRGAQSYTAHTLGELVELLKKTIGK
ncbi:MAG: hypothetical protein AABO41_10615 [Acidobacteriota bacterium]